MFAASERLLSQKRATDGTPQASHDAMRVVARAFNRLYHFRQLADYDMSSQWTRSETVELVDIASEAFGAVKSIRNEAVLHDFLLSLFVKDRSVGAYPPLWLFQAAGSSRRSAIQSLISLTVANVPKAPANSPNGFGVLPAGWIMTRGVSCPLVPRRLPTISLLPIPAVRISGA